MNQNSGNFLFARIERDYCNLLLYLDFWNEIKKDQEDMMPYWNQAQGCVRIVWLLLACYNHLSAESQL
jgi:hypothetical protein